MKFYDAVVGGRSVGVPGTLRLLEAAHKRWGKLPWAQLFEPAIRSPRTASAISPRLNGLLAQEPYLAKNDDVARAYFFEADGKPKAVGTVLKNPAFAQTLRAIAAGGADAFYSGADRRRHRRDGRRPPDESRRHDRSTTSRPTRSRSARRSAASTGPSASAAWARRAPAPSPSSRSSASLEPVDMAALKPGPEAVALHRRGRAARLCGPGALSRRSRLRERAGARASSIPATSRAAPALIDPQKSMGRAQARRAAVPEDAFSTRPSDGIEFGTSHMSIVDGDGNAVAMTTTIEDGFGARLMTKGGFLLNNELTDFSFAAEEDGKPVANRVEAEQAPALLDGADDRASIPSASSTPPSARRAAARSSTTSPRPSSASSTGSSTRRSPRTCRTSAAATARPSSRRAPRPKPGRLPSRRRATRCA